MVLLAFETATNACSVALLHQGIVYERFEIAPRQHTALLLPMIADLLNEHGLSRKDIDAIAFGRGPGSFMGVRLATGVAQGLAYALGRPLIPVSTLQILAQTAYETYSVDYVISAWDARMGEVYWGVYELQEGVMMTVTPDALSAPADLIIKREGAALVGNAWSTYAANFKTEVMAARTCYAECYPRARSLVAIAQQLAAFHQTVSPFSVEPIYIRDKIC